VHDGYGFFGFNGRTSRANRVAWELTYGPIPEGLVVCHRCDNRRCVNPAHLFLGTVADNVRDMDQKGRRRACRGEDRRNAKLTEHHVRVIRYLRDNGVSLSQRRQAEMFGVNHTTIERIGTRREWGHVQ